MSLRADFKYNGKVMPGSQLYSTQTGTIGYQVMLECEDGETTFTIWLTEKNRKRAEKYFEILGVEIPKLKNPGYLEYQLAGEIDGKEVSFGTREEEYNGKFTVKVAWIGKKSDPNLAKSAASFFGGNGNAPVVPPKQDPITDDDIPF